MSQLQDDNPRILLYAGVLAFLLGISALLMAEAHIFHGLLMELEWIAEVVR